MKLMKFLHALNKSEKSAGIFLFAAAVLALILANSPLAALYETFFHTPFTIQIAFIKIQQSLIFWINDALMMFFFLFIGLQIKRELFGELHNIYKAVLPAVGAIGGVAVPVLIYLFINWNNPQAIAGWAIPTATDITFSLGVLFLLGTRVSLSIKIFLTTLAVLDDVFAIIIIAIFYSDHFFVLGLVFVVISIFVLIMMNRLGIQNKLAYLFVGFLLWGSFLATEIHPTLAGIILAFTIPIIKPEINANEKKQLVPSWNLTGSRDEYRRNHNFVIVKGLLCGAMTTTSEND